MPINYAISDLHFGHSRIIEFERTEFKTIQEHDEHIIQKWNSVVGKDDTVFVLGDVSLSDQKNDVSEKLSRLNGHKILVMGNHDHCTKTFYRNSGFEDVNDGPIFIQNGKIILSHEPAKEAYENPYAINIYGHLHGSYVNLPNFITVSAKMVD